MAENELSVSARAKPSFAFHYITLHYALDHPNQKDKPKVSKYCIVVPRKVQVCGARVQVST